ncbi:pyrimidine 5'-nucleotidase [Sphingomonas ginkgonis]|uniref:Pyrimidine 5'-nucleotidase n=1 Tax=Sphingomonas ginkgonis TaxID=2315330 RepID=A0A3R9WNH4_9SPHN|nr:pyrimidine 5'-nucleotidase [Sphingomonas ginkgonis]RST29645.1 pyrimidine 5'-nucleotidase [Sphingomonas ginkgonis]
MDPRFAHIRDWIFDLDNTLYPASTRLFDLIDERMSAYVQRLLDCAPEQARSVQKQYFREHGTTLAGLIRHHDVDPHHFLDDVHDIALDRVAHDERLARALEALPGRRFVFTNGNQSYAERVLRAIGIGDHFHGLVDIHACSYLPKPDAHGYRLLVERFGIEPDAAVLVEDMARNLEPAKAMGMTTVWVNNGSEHGDHLAGGGFIDHEISDVGDWLASILGEEE